MFALLAALLLAAPAQADYRRIPGPPVDAGFVFQGESLLVGAAGVLTAHAPDGSTRVIKLPTAKAKLDYVRASDQALAVELENNTQYARLNGKRWRKLTGRKIGVDADVSGTKGLVLREDPYEDRSRFDIISLRTGKKLRSFRIKERRVIYVQVVGDYFAYLSNFAVYNRETVVVKRISTGREVYRKRFGRIGDYQLLPGGKVAITTLGTYDRAWFVRVHENGRWRTIREVSEMPRGQLEVTAAGILLIRQDAQQRHDIWLLADDGQMRPLTPLVPDEINSVASDGKRIAFDIGGCVFLGDIPAAGVPLPAVPAEGCVRS